MQVRERGHCEIDVRHADALKNFPTIGAVRPALFCRAGIKMTGISAEFSGGAGVVAQLPRLALQKPITIRACALVRFLTFPKPVFCCIDASFCSIFQSLEDDIR